MQRVVYKDTLMMMIANMNSKPFARIFIGV